MALDKEQIEAIKKDAAENWNGDVSLAAAAFVQGAGVVRRCGNQIMDWFDKKQIATIKGLITKSETATKTPAKKKREMKFEIYQDEKGEFRWRLKGANGEIIAVSSEGYTTDQMLKKTLNNLISSVAKGEITRISYGHGCTKQKTGGK